MADSDTDVGVSASRSLLAQFGLATLLLILFLTFLDNTIVSVVLANIQQSLHAGVTELQWIINGYALVFAALMLTFGALGDLFGRKRVMLAGVAIFCAGSVLAALANTTGILIIGRVVMGVGAAASEPGTLSMIRQIYTEDRRRARALGSWAAVSGLALALGPVIGGTLAGLWSWRAIFWFNLLFGLVAFVAAAVVLPESADPEGRRVDVAGFLLGSGAVAAAIYAVIAGETAGYRSWWVDALFAMAAVAMVAFVAYELRARGGVLDVSYFRQPPFLASNLTAFAAYFGTFAIFFFVALYVEVVGSQSPYAVALDFVPMAVLMVAASLFTGRWVAAYGPRGPMTIGCVVAAAGIIATDVFLTPQTSFSTLGWTLAIAGVGFGVAIVPVTSTALSVIPQQRSGMAASTTNTSRELGGVTGVAVLGSMINAQLTVHLIHRLQQIGIPKAFQQLVITAVITGSVSSQAKAAEKIPGVVKIINDVVNAAYAAFSHGLDLALSAAAALMLVGAVVSFLSLRSPPIHR